MKNGVKIGVVALLGGLGLALGASSASAEDLKFALKNKAHGPMTAFYVSAAGHDKWEENLFPRNAVLPVGNVLDIHIKDELTSCNYDLKAVFKDGSESEAFDVDMCKLNNGSYTYTK